MAFIGVGEELTGKIYSLENPNKALGTLEARDVTFESGLIGIATIATGGGIRTDATFDNFIAYDPNCPPTIAEPPAELHLKQLERAGNLASLTIEGATEDEALVILRSSDLEIWTPVYHTREGQLLEISSPMPEAEYYRVGRSLANAKLALTVTGRTRPSDEEACQEIIKLIPTELAEGAGERLFLKDTGEGEHFGAYTSEFALDVFFATVPGFDDPVPVATAGWIIQTQEDGSKVFWHTTSEFQPDASSKVRSEILWGTGMFEKVTGVVIGTSVPEDPANPADSPYDYRDTGWIRFSSGDR